MYFIPVIISIKNNNLHHFLEVVETMNRGSAFHVDFERGCSDLRSREEVRLRQAKSRL